MSGGHRPVRIAVNALHAKTGGGLTYLRSILPLIAADPDIEVDLIVHRDQLKLLGDTDSRIRVRPFDYPRSFVLELLWEQLLLPFALRSIGADVVYSPANFGPLLPSKSVVLLRNALAVSERETRLAKRLYWAALRVMTALSIIRSRESIAVSRYAAATLTAGLPPAARRKVTVIPHGVRPIFLQVAPAVPREDFLLVVADIYIQKNLHTFVEALAIVRREFPDVQVKIAGRLVDRDYLARVQSLMDAHGLTRAVEFLGVVDEGRLADLYRRCRLFVFPSTVETFGHPLVEAMACGAAVACSSTTAMPEVLGDSGLYFDPTDAADMARCIGELYNNEALREELGRRGRERAQQFSLVETAERSARVLKRVALGEPAGSRA